MEHTRLVPASALSVCLLYPLLFGALVPYQAPTRPEVYVSSLRDSRAWFLLDFCLERSMQGQDLTKRNKSVCAFSRSISAHPRSVLFIFGGRSPFVETALSLQATIWCQFAEAGAGNQALRPVPWTSRNTVGLGFVGETFGAYKVLRFLALLFQEEDSAFTLDPVFGRSSKFSARHLISRL